VDLDTQPAELVAGLRGQAVAEARQDSLSTVEEQDALLRGIDPGEVRAQAFGV
jgi:hypothetical protein